MFNSQNDAAKNRGLYYGDNSIRRNREYGSDHYQVVTNGKVQYAYSKARVGEERKLPITSKYPHGTAPPPDGKEVVSWIHSRGSYDETNTYVGPEENLGREFSEGRKY
ncbi:MAG: hypothetical protein ACI837_001888 [Crocinitomicaceae bacterium]